MKRLLTLGLLSAILQFTNSSLVNAQSKADEISDLLSLYKSYDIFNGSALVSDGGEIIHEGGNGWANIEWKIQNSSNTKHRLGSITKQFTAMLILQLMEEGKIDLQAPITKYLPDYPRSTGDIITTHHLLTHTSGLPNYTSFPGFFQNDSRDPYTPVEFVEVFSDSTLNFEPGSSFEYSNSGYFLLGVLIEELTGNTYEEELKTRIFDVVGMKDTGYDNHPDILENRAAGYERQGMSYINAPYLDMSIPYAAGSMYSTVEDLYKWDQALYTEKLISNESKEMMFGEHTEAFGGHYAYGWMLNEVDGQKVIMHGGGINGFNTIIARFPESKDCIILLNNTGGTDLQEMAQSIKRILDGKDYDKPKKSAVRSFMSMMSKEGFEKGKAHLMKIKDDEGYDFSEGEMNSFGYQLLQEGKKSEALSIFKLNLEAFPESWNAYDSYAEGLMETGDREGAIKNYKKSVQMNPGNNNGIAMLEKLGIPKEDVVEDVKVSEEVLATYIGKYELQPGFVITVSKEGENLFAQATGQDQFQIYPKSETSFYLKVVQAQLEFNKDTDGKIKSLTLMQGGQTMEAKKIE